VFADRPVVPLTWPGFLSDRHADDCPVWDRVRLTSPVLILPRSTFLSRLMLMLLLPPPP
jgi:hypothetical protein